MRRAARPTSELGQGTSKQASLYATALRRLFDPDTEEVLWDWSAHGELGDGQPISPRLSYQRVSPIDPPSGCRFHTRCFAKIGAICEEQEPVITSVGTGHTVACHLF